MDHVAQQVVIEAHDVTVEAGHARLAGRWSAPPEPRGAVVFAHGSGSNRHSPRNVDTAAHLQERGFGTLLFDLLTAEETGIDAFSGDYRFDVELLAGRIVQAIQWLQRSRNIAGKPVGCFGAGIGGAAVLEAAAMPESAIDALVLRGGHVELAEEAIPFVKAPTLLIVGENDIPALSNNRGAVADFNAEVDLRIVAGATHMFDAPGTLAEAARWTGDWFDRHLKNRVTRHH